MVAHNQHPAVVKVFRARTRSVYTRARVHALVVCQGDLRDSACVPLVRVRQPETDWIVLARPVE